jgi:hypothetical protein
MYSSRFIYSFFLFLILNLGAWSQTTVDLASQSKRIDFSGFPFTRPVKIGTTNPTSCSIGDLFFKSDASPGSNLLACVGSDTWQALGAGLPSQSGAIERLLSSNGINASWVLLGGDVSGTPLSLRVDKLLNRPLDTTAPVTGSALIWNGTAWAPAASPNGSVAVALDGTALANRGLLNIIGGSGILTSLTDTGTRIDFQQNLDTAVVLTREVHRSNSELLCSSAGASATAYTCSLSFPLTAYVSNMVLYWKPDVNAAGGATTLKIGSLDAKPVKLADGTTNPEASNINAGSLYPVWYDGTSFRMISVLPPPAPVPPNQGLLANRPTCTVAIRGELWFVEGPTGTKDEYAVCAKNASNAYDWRIIY